MKPQSATSLPSSAEADRHARMIRYSVMMIIRMVCLLLCVFVQGWWLLLCAAGAVFLPYIAVVTANVGTARRSAAAPLRPGAVLPYRPAPSASSSEPFAPSTTAEQPYDDEPHEERR